MLSSNSLADSVDFDAVLRDLIAERERRAEARRRLEEIKSDADAVRARCKTMIGFARESWHILEPTTPFIEGWHQDALCHNLEAVTAGEIQRLQINEPPGMARGFWPRR